MTQYSEPQFAPAQEARPAEVAKVVRVMGTKATVELHPSAACAGCQAVHVCLLGSDMVRRAAVNDPIGVRVGDSVEIALRPNALLKASFIMYIVPLIALFGGLLLGQHLAPHLGRGLSPEVAAMVFGLGFLVLAFLCIRRLSGRLERSGNYTPVITRVLGQVESDLCATEVSPGKKDG